MTLVVCLPGILDLRFAPLSHHKKTAQGEMTDWKKSQQLEGLCACEDSGGGGECSVLTCNELLLKDRRSRRADAQSVE